jgi:ribosomal-protein-alanine N-acetyltransferase
MKLHRIEALDNPANLGSHSVLEKAGFTFEGTLRDYEFFKGKYHTFVCYAKLDLD